MMVTLALLQIFAILDWQEGPGLINHEKGNYKLVLNVTPLSLLPFCCCLQTFVGVLLRVRKQQGKSAKPP